MAGIKVLLIKRCLHCIDIIADHCNETLSKLSIGYFDQNNLKTRFLLFLFQNTGPGREVLSTLEKYKRRAEESNIKDKYDGVPMFKTVVLNVFFHTLVWIFNTMCSLFRLKSLQLKYI